MWFEPTQLFRTSSNARWVSETLLRIFVMGSTYRTDHEKNDIVVRDIQHEAASYKQIVNLKIVLLLPNLSILMPDPQH